LKVFIQLLDAKTKVICALCKRNLNPGTPSVKKSTIKNAKNGLFAEKNYFWGEEITSYNGNIYSKKSLLPSDTSYVLSKNGIYIDGKYNFGDSKGRYINSPPVGKKANCIFGHTKIGHSIMIRAIQKPKNICKNRKIAIYAGEEFFLSYGAGYWKGKKKS
jgi:hypothetical protein